ncbi:ABC transporter ATP-binding protein [Thermaerobacter litoralis]
MNDRSRYLIEAQDVEFAYSARLATPVRALAGVSLPIAPGEHVAIVGSNGSGKSTLARHFNALLVPTAGTVRVDGHDTRGAAADPALRKRIRATVGMVFQNPDSQIVATVVQEDVAFGPENLGVPRPELQRRVAEALEWVGMRHAALRPPHLLSAGQRQRVAIAGVLAMGPRAVVFDEATAMLDPSGRQSVMAILDRLQEDGVTVIQVTHHMDEAARAQRVVILHQGRIAADGPPDTVLVEPDRLKAFGLDVPPTVAIARQVARFVPGFPTRVMTAAGLVEAVLRHLDGRGTGGRPTSFAGPVSFAGPISAAGPGSSAGAISAAGTDAATGVSPDGGPRAGGGQGPVPPPRRVADPILEVEELSHDYMRGTPLAHRALHGVSLAVGRGEVVALIGQTGSGKSTLIQHFNGLLRPQQGRVWVAGFDLENPRTDLRALRRRVGIVFQRPEDQLFERYVGDDVAFGPYKDGLRGEALRERVRWAMGVVGLDFETFRDRPIFALSGGQRRKVALAGVLALRPEVLVLDEPTAGLDPQSRDELLSILAELREREGLTVVLVSHNLDEVARLADYAYVLAGGRVVGHGTPRQLFAQPAALEAVGLDVPPASRVAHGLRAAGVPVPPDAMHPHEVAEAIVRCLTMPHPAEEAQRRAGV